LNGLVGGLDVDAGVIRDLVGKMPSGCDGTWQIAFSGNNAVSGADSKIILSESRGRVDNSSTRVAIV
jgi:hypothetical protein